MAANIVLVYNCVFKLGKRRCACLVLNGLALTGCKIFCTPSCVVAVSVRWAVSRPIPHCLAKVSFVIMGPRSVLFNPAATQTIASVVASGSWCAVKTTALSSLGPNSDLTLMADTICATNSSSSISSITESVRFHCEATAICRSSRMYGR